MTRAQMIMLDVVMTLAVAGVGTLVVGYLFFVQLPEVLQ